MAFTSLTKIVSVNNSKIDSDSVKKNNTLNEVFRSGTLKRLLQQPNIVIKAITPPVTGPRTISSKNKSYIEKSASGKDVLVTSDDECENDEFNLLPSKTREKSEIALLPLYRERKSCGHYEPCENIVCDIHFQQYVDRDGSSPLVAVNIDASEITASVSKHCDNVLCDSLSIDHDRCRRAIIYLHRCDKINICDICRTPLKTRRIRVRHKNCKRKNEYQHNQVNQAQLMRQRMRIRELQIIEAIRTRQNDYSDPITGNVKAMEVLKNNSELIVIPTTNTNTLDYYSPDDSSVDVSEASTIKIVNITSCSDIVTNVSTALNTYLPTASQENKTHIINISSSAKQNNEMNNDQVIVTGIPQNSISYPLTSNNWVMTPSLKETISQLPAPYFMPVKIIPIKNLKSQPSLQHHTQGIPKFYIVPDTSAISSKALDVQTSVPAAVVDEITATEKELQISQVKSLKSQQSVQVNTTETKSTDDEVKTEKPITNANNNNNTNTRKSSYKRKKPLENKLFQCSYCSKRFLTDWYFKLHVARHTGEKKIACNYCDMVFTNNYDLKRHINTEHKDEDPNVNEMKSNKESVSKTVDKGKHNGISSSGSKNNFESNNELKMQEL